VTNRFLVVATPAVPYWPIESSELTC